MPTELIAMLETFSATVDGNVLLRNEPEAWVIYVNGIEKFRLEKTDE